MKLIICVFVFMTLVCLAWCIAEKSRDDEWKQFKKTYNKIYESDEIELERRSIWQENYKFIYRHNKEAKRGDHSFVLSMNKFGDLTNFEFIKMYTGFKATANKVDRPKFKPPLGFKVPNMVDWRDEGYVTPVKDQGECGACWAFSAVAALEGQHFKSTGQLVSLSEQNLIDCSHDQGNLGCESGTMDQAFAYVIANNGVATEDSYPYKASDESCNFTSAIVGATATGFFDIESGNEADLTTAIASVGPISCTFDASQPSFQFYSSGVYSDQNCSSTNLDHAVTAVGFASNRNNIGRLSYYIVKNSWGDGWGESGYVRVARNANNMCGIATMSSYPIVS